MEEKMSNHFPEEILINILSRLPAKSVGRWRCVSKPWRALLFQPQFIKTHLEGTRKFLPESLIFICGSEQSPSEGYLGTVHQLSDDEIPLTPTHLTFPDEYSNWTRVHGSCDGLVLVENNDGKIFVLNPVTRETRQVPPSPFVVDDDPDSAAIMYGFGYDSVNDDYKVVILSLDTTDSDAMFYDNFVSLYSLKTGTWKAVGDTFFWEFLNPLTPGVYVEGRIHWMASGSIGGEDGIMAFDLAEERFYQVPPPGGCNKFCGLGFLVALSGHLCLVIGRKHDVWVMNEYGVEDSWTKFSVDEQHEEYKSRPLCKLGRDRVVLLQRGDKKLVAYDLNDKSRKEILVDGISGYVFDEACFLESLVSP